MLLQTVIRPGPSVFLVLLTACWLVLSACSDEGTQDSDGAGVADSGTGADGTRDEGRVDLADRGGAEDGGGEDEPRPPRASCGVLPALDETATYDVVTPLVEFVGSGDMTRAGNTVAVVIEDPNEDEPTAYEGDFEDFDGMLNCIVAETEDLTADLCFYNPDGTPAGDTALGANLYGFIHGAPHASPTATLLGAVRRDVDRSCSPGGFFMLDSTSVSATTGDLSEGVIDAAISDLLTYLAVFDLGAERFSAVIGTLKPVEIQLLGSEPLDGVVDVVHRGGLTVEVAEVTIDLDLEMTLVGSVDFATGVFEGTATIELENDETSGILEGQVTGQRN